MLKLSSKSIFLGLLLTLFGLTAPTTLFAHGGRYAGPSATPPPPATPPPGTYGGPKDSGGGAPRGPNTQGPALPSGPSKGGATPSPGGGTRGGTGVSSGFYDISQDLSRWELWWDLNKHSLLNLRSSLFVEGPSTGGGADAVLEVDRLRPSDSDLRENVVPKLLFVLRHERNPDLVTGAIVALAKIGLEPSLSSEFAHLLADSNQEIAETATLGLGLLRDARALPALRSLALDDAEGRSFCAKPSVPTRTRIFAIYALGLFGSRTPDLAARERIVDGLRAVTSTNSEVLIARTLSLGMVQDPQRRGAEDLRRLLDDRSADSRVRAMAPISLSRLLCETGESSGRNVHPLAAVVCERVLRIAEDLQEPEWMRASCIQALPHLAATGEKSFAVAALKTLLRALQDGKTGSERQLAAIALGRMGGAEAQEALAKFLGKGTMRPWAALGLGLLARENPSGASTVMAKLREAFEGEKNPSTAAAIAVALGLARDTASGSLLLARLESTSNEELKGYLALSLGMVGAREALPSIAKVAREALRRPDLQKQAVMALGLLGDRSVAPEIARQLGEARTLSAQASLASAVGWIGDRRSLDLLVPMLESVKLAPMGRAFVAAAVGMIGDRNEVHWSAAISSDLNYYAAPPSLLDPAGFAGLLDIL